MPEYRPPTHRRGSPNVGPFWVGFYTVRASEYINSRWSVVAHGPSRPAPPSDLPPHNKMRPSIEGSHLCLWDADVARLSEWLKESLGAPTKFD